MKNNISEIFQKIKLSNFLNLSKFYIHMRKNMRPESIVGRKLFMNSKLSYFSNSVNGNISHTVQNSSNSFDMQTYLKEVEGVLNHIYETLDVMDLEVTDNITLSDGVLKISFKKNRHFVINIQRPNLQIWLSSPFSGPQRFEFNMKEGKWENIRNKKSILTILEDEFNQILKSENSGKEIKLQ